MDEKDHRDKDFEAETERQKSIEEILDCKFTRINQAKENFNVFNEIGRIKVFTSESKEKSLIKKISNRLLNLEFKSESSIKIKCLKHVVKKILPEFDS